jgi:hypothetical protein
MENKRVLLRLDVEDFLQIRPLNEQVRYVKGKSKDFTLMGICFSSAIKWNRGQLLLIEYFIPQEMDSVKLKLVVVWSELIDKEQGYFCGGEIVEVEDGKQRKFAAYYFEKLKERFSR